MNHKQIQDALDDAHPDLRHEVARDNGMALYDLTCSCGRIVQGKAVSVSGHRDYDPRNEVRYLACPACGVKGQYQVKATKLPTPKAIEKARAEVAEKRQKSVSEDIDAQIRALQARKAAVLVPKAQPKAEDAQPQP